MTVLETDTPPFVPLPLHEQEALLRRYNAARRLLRDMASDEERWDLLAAVVWPADPLLHSSSLTSSATE